MAHYVSCQIETICLICETDFIKTATREKELPIEAGPKFTR